MNNEEDMRTIPQAEKCGAPKVSIIVPAYNSEDCIVQSLLTASEQTLKDIEIIVVDDGSTDSTKELLKRYGERDKRLVVISQQNKGAGEARNAALAAARGLYVSFLDADDAYPADTVLERLVNAAETHDVSIAGGSKLVKSEKGIRKKKGQTFTEEGLIKYADFQKDYDYQCYIFSLKMLKDNGIVFPPYRRYQDPPFFIRAMIASDVFYAIPDATYTYTKDPEHVKWNPEKTTDMIKGISDCLILSRKHGLAKLHCKTIQRLEKDYRERIINNCCRDVIEALLYAEKQIDTKLANEGADGDVVFQDDYRVRVIEDSLIEAGAARNSAIQKELEKANKELKRIKSGRAYKISCLLHRRKSR